MSRTEPEPAQPSASPHSTLSSLVCAGAIGLSTVTACCAGFFGWTMWLYSDSPAESVDLPLMCAGVPVSLGLAIGVTVSVMRWRDRAEPSLASTLLLAVVLAVSAGFVTTLFRSGPNGLSLGMRLTIHTADSSYFGERSSVAVGEVVAFGGGRDGDARVPDGWMPADGRALARADYPELSNRLGAAFGGDEQTLRLPRLEGMYSPELVQRTGEIDSEGESSRFGQMVYEGALALGAPPDANESERAAGAVLWLVRVKP